MREISVTDYFTELLIANGITDVFGYQGGMAAYFFDSFGKYRTRIHYHSCATEQGAAFAACGYAQATGKWGVAVSTSGPGFTNLLTGMANAWFDSIPLICISGQVNTKDKRRTMTLRQFGFQEIQAPMIAEPITKKSYEIDNTTDIESCFNEAFCIAMSGRKGPVFLDFPINICRNTLSVDYVHSTKTAHETGIDVTNSILHMCQAQKPVIIAGAGVNQAGIRDEFQTLVNLLDVPVVTSLPAVDLLPSNSKHRMGYIGGTARREANIILANADLVLSLGSRLGPKQIGYNLNNFAPKAKLIRIDVDNAEFERKLKPDELQIHADLRDFISSSIKFLSENDIQCDHSVWLERCNQVKEVLAGCDDTFGNAVIRNLTDLLPSGSNILLDVGNNLIYGAQSSVVKQKTRVFASCGLGAMGYSIPASLGVCLGKPQITCAITGDGGAQMNIQELNTISNKQLPIKIFVMNNRALGHILLFQEHYLDSRFVATSEKQGDFYSCNFVELAKAYNIRAISLKDEKDIINYREILLDNKPALFELEYEDCSILPNIHAGDDCLIAGPELPKCVVSKIKGWMNL